MVVKFKDGVDASWHHDFNEWLIECLEIITDRNEKYNLDTGPEMHHVRMQDGRFYILTSKNDVNGNIYFRIVSEKETPENRHDLTRRSVFSQNMPTLVTGNSRAFLGSVGVRLRELLVFLLPLRLSLYA